MAFAFENLLVYQKAVDFSYRISELSGTVPRRFYFLTDRINRALLPALLAALAAAPVAWAADITRGGQPAELTVTIAAAHSVRVTLTPVGTQLPPSPSLLDLTIKNPAISLRTTDGPVQAHVGTLDVEVTPAPLTVLVKNAAGREVQKLSFDDQSGDVSFNVGDSPVLGMGEGGQQPARGTGPVGIQFDRRGKLDPMRPGWGSGTLGSRNPVAVLAGTDGWGLFVASPWVQVDLRNPGKGIFIPTNYAGVDTSAEAQGFDIFVFDASEPPDMMKDLRDLTGAAAMPPKWALGYQQSHRELRDANMAPQELILNVVDTPHNGGTTVARRVDLATMPIYVRAGSIIPFDPVRQYMAQPVTEPTALKVYRGADGQFTMYEDDGISQDYIQNNGTWTKLAWDDAAKELTIAAAPPAGVTNESTAAREFRVELLPAGTVKTVTYDGRQAEVKF